MRQAEECEVRQIIDEAAAQALGKRQHVVIDWRRRLAAEPTITNAYAVDIIWKRDRLLLTGSYINMARRNGTMANRHKPLQPVIRGKSYASRREDREFIREGDLQNEQPTRQYLSNRIRNS